MEKGLGMPAPVQSVGLKAQNGQGLLLESAGEAIYAIDMAR